jgi:hypothetical protein
MDDPLLDLLNGGSAPQNAQSGQDPLLSLVNPSGQTVGTVQRVNQPAQTKSFGKDLSDTIADMPRQLGLTARYGLEGVGGMFDTFIGNPLRTLASPILGNKPTADTGKTLADLVHLPEPQTPTERIVGDASRMVAGSALPIAAGANLAKNGVGTAQQVGKVISSNPGQQLLSAGSSGLAGGYTRETGGDNAAQFVASLAGGLAAPAAVGMAKNGTQAAANIGRNLMGRGIDPQQIDITISNALKDTGINLGDLPANVANGIRSDVADAYKLNGTLSPDAVRRLADYRLVGATPTAARLTLDPAAVTQQANLAKLGANSKDAAAQQLARTQNRNNQVLINGLNDLGAGSAGDSISGAQDIIGALSGRNARAQGIINDLYSKARDSAGRAAPLDPYAFSQRAGDLLNEANVESFLTPDIRNKLNGFASGQIPLNVDIAEQFKTNLGSIQRNSTDGNVRKALGLVRQALDETPLLNQQAGNFGGNQMTAHGGLASAAPSLGQDAMDAFNKARLMNRSWMQIVERTPALQAVRDGIEPDKFVQQYIVGGGPKADVMDVAMLKNSIKSSPDAMTAVKSQITSFLKQKALNGAADEVGNFSQSFYNKALQSIGDRKLNLFFSKDEINQLKAIGRVASYEQFQPVGSAVNNSNTASTGMAALLDRIGGSSILSKIPFGKVIAEPVQNIAIGMKSTNALNAPAALVGGQQPLAPMLQEPSMMLSPAVFMGQGSEEEKKKRQLFTPVP